MVPSKSLRMSTIADCAQLRTGRHRRLPGRSIIASRRITSHLSASQRIASHRIASHRIAVRRRRPRVACPAARLI
jgi:hypothetical protein